MNKLPPIPEKKYFSISEVACLCELKAHTLRFWEKKIRQIRPSIKAGNRRYYSRKDLETVKIVKYLTLYSSLNL